MRENDKKTIALTGGSTGGHIFPLLSIYNYLKEDEKYNFYWVGEEEGLEFDIALDNNIDFLDIPSGKIRRYFDVRNFYEPLKNLSGIFFGIYYILKYKIDIVFSKGGYVSLPLCIAAFILRKKIYIHESDTVGGVANKLIGRIATKVFYSFPNELTNEEENQKHIFSGQILNADLLDKINDLEVTENERLSILVIAGSQGSTTIFKSLTNVLDQLKDIDFKIILGEKNIFFKDEFRKFPNVRTYDFISQKDMGGMMKNTDIAITRAGATSLWELNMFGIHSIIIPLEGSASDHQYKNAMYFNERFGSDIIEQDEKLEENLINILTKYKNLRKSGLNLDNFFKASKIIEEEINKD